MLKLASLTFLAALALVAQPPPKVPPGPALVTVQGNQVVVTLPYALGPNTDSVLTSITAPVAREHRRLNAGAAATGDTMQFVRPAGGVLIAGQICATAQRNPNKKSQPACSPFSYTEPDPSPPPAPIVQPATVDTTATPGPGPGEAVLFFDDFRTGARAGTQNGIRWTGTNGPAPPTVVADPANPSGFSLRFRFGPNAIGSDGFSEQNLAFSDPFFSEMFFCLQYRLPGNYFHRSDGASNNKGIRVFGGRTASSSRDSAYAQSSVHIGYSTLPKSTTSSSYGESQLIVEYGTPAGTGNWGTGSWALFGAKDMYLRVGFYAKVGTMTRPATAADSTSNTLAGDGVITVWRNGAKVYDRQNLALFRTDRPGWLNRFQYAYLLGWANSGFAEQTDVMLEWIKVSLQPLASCLTAP